MDQVNSKDVSANPYPLEESTGYLLFRLSKGLQLQFESRIRHLKLTAPQWGLLNACYQNQAQTPTEFARLMAIDNAAVTRHVQNLKRRGLLSVEPHESDRRSYRVSLTPKAVRLVESVIPISRQMNMDMLSSLSQDEKEAFVRTLVQLLEANHLLDS